MRVLDQKTLSPKLIFDSGVIQLKDGEIIRYGFELGIPFFFILFVLELSDTF